MATYKAEFLSHYYAGRLRPRSAYAVGLIHWWSRLASRAPGLANLFTQSPGCGSMTSESRASRRERELPAFASETFQQWFARRGVRNAGGKRVMLWPDTFNNYFHPEVREGRGGGSGARGLSGGSHSAEHLLRTAAL